MIFLQTLKFCAFKSRSSLFQCSDEILVKASKRKDLFCLRVSVGSGEAELHGGRAKQSQVAHLLLVRKRREAERVQDKIQLSSTENRLFWYY